MPLYNFVCSECGVERRVLAQKDPLMVLCKECGSESYRQASGPTSKTVECLDNGIMTKRLERLADAERIYAEHRKAHQND